MVCGVFDTTPDDNAVTIKDLNPGKGIRNRDEVGRNTDIGSKVGSPTNPHATTKPMLRDV